MEIRQQIVRRLIIILEGCLVKLKEVDSRYSGNETTSYSQNANPIDSNEVFDDAKEKTEKDKDESFFNISLLDGYVAAIGLSTGSNIVKIIQRVECLTELNAIDSLLQCIPNKEQLVVLYKGLKEEEEVIRFENCQPSPIRSTETRIVEKDFIKNELSVLNIAYDETQSLFDNCMRLFNAKQKNVIKSCLSKIDDIMTSIQQQSNEDSVKQYLAILEQTLTNRKKILEIKMKR